MAKIDKGKLSTFRPQENNANRHTERGLGMLSRAYSEVGYVAPMTAAADGMIMLYLGAKVWYNRGIRIKNDGSGGADNTGKSLAVFMLKRSNEMDTPIIDQKEYIVYLITNRVNGKMYVGITSQGLNLRFRSHFNKARITSDNRKFYNAIRKYGEENFYIEYLDGARSYEELKEKEKEYIRKLDTYNSGYNSTFGGDGTLGTIPNEEVRQKNRKQKTEHFAIKENRDRFSRMNAILSDEQVLEICRLAQGGQLLVPQIAEMFNVGPTTISEILNFKTYRHVDREFVGARGIEAARCKLEMVTILRLYHDGLEYSDIGEKVGLDKNTVWRKLKTELGHSPVSPDMRRYEARNNIIADEYKSGKSLRMIADTVGIHIETVRKQLKRLGLYSLNDQ